MVYKNKILLLLVFALIAAPLFIPLFVSMSQSENQQLENQEGDLKTSLPAEPEPEIKIVIVTAYSSTPDQTDENPLITASGVYVRDGIIAANFLAFGTKVKFPTIYEDKIFVVEDRMKNNHQVDIWFPTREQALEFGVKRLPMLIIGSN